MKFWGRPKVEGFIAYYGLKDWWLATFTEAEREYIDKKYQPLGSSLHSLTPGKRSSPQAAPDYLNGMKTWFRCKDDASIADRIHRKIVDLGKSKPKSKPGYYDGRHYTTYVDDVKKLKREGRLEEAERILLELVNALEEENKKEKMGVAPWYYEQLAKIYRKQKTIPMR